MTESLDAPEASHQSPGQPEYVVVLRASSSAYYLPEDGWQQEISAPALRIERAKVKTFTRWVGTGTHPAPRELIVEVRGPANSLDEAVATFSTIARPVATTAGFVANVRVGPAEVHIAYDCTPDRDDREFLETFLPDESGPPGDGRIIRQDLMIPTFTALAGMGRNGARVSRAIRQYELALREWRVGGEWLALSHLYMAVEALTKAVIRQRTARDTISEVKFAESLGVVTDDPDRPKWIDAMGQRVRSDIIFKGDSDTFQAAKKASDGLEHGFLELDTIAAHAIRCADKTFHHVRRTIVELMDLPPEVAADLMAIKPKDVQSRTKVVRGRLLGPAADPAPDGELYPRLEWRSGINSIVREGVSFTFPETERITVRTNPNVTFQLTRLEVRGRLEDGQSPAVLSDADVVIDTTEGAPHEDLIDQVLPLVDAATASKQDAPQTIPRTLAFNLFGQGVAFFQSAQTLIAAGQPVEALPSLRGLVQAAARFEQINEADGPGVGVVIRLLLDSLEGSDSGDTQRDSIVKSADTAGITVPSELAMPHGTRVWQCLGHEMRLADHVANVSFAAIGLHVEGSDGRIGFSTRLKPSPLTDLVASACVMAQLTLLKEAARVFDWAIEDEAIDSLYARAQTLNNASAQDLAVDRERG